MTAARNWWESGYINDIENMLIHTTWALGINHNEYVGNANLALMTIKKFGNQQQIESFKNDISYVMAERDNGSFLNKIQTTVCVDKDGKYMVLNTTLEQPKRYIGTCKTGTAVVLARMVMYDEEDRGLVWVVVNQTLPGVYVSVMENCHEISGLNVYNVEYNNTRLVCDESLLKGSMSTKSPYLLLSTIRHMFRFRYERWREMCNSIRTLTSTDPYHCTIIKICISQIIKDCICDLRELEGAATMFTDFTLSIPKENQREVFFTGENDSQCLEIFHNFRHLKGLKNRILGKRLLFLDTRNISKRANAYTWLCLYDLMRPKDSFTKQYVKNKISC